MIDEEKYKVALKFATEKHEGQFRVGGMPYITHPVAVAQKLKEKGFGEDYVITALFHDLLEDTDATEQEIEKIGGTVVLEAVKILTKEKNYDIDAYVSGINKNVISKTVKAMDRLHNLECAVYCSETFKRRYVLETVKYFMDFDKEIPLAVKNLIKSMESPITDIDLN